MKNLYEEQIKHCYRKIKIFDDKGIRKMFYVHRLIWQAFFGEIPKGYEVDHIDFNRSNNRLNNLRVIPAAVNRVIRKWRKAV